MASFCLNCKQDVGTVRGMVLPPALAALERARAKIAGVMDRADPRAPQAAALFSALQDIDLALAALSAPGRGEQVLTAEEAVRVLNDHAFVGIIGGWVLVNGVVLGCTSGPGYRMPPEAAVAVAQALLAPQGPSRAAALEAEQDGSNAG